MITNIDISGTNYKVEEAFTKYAVKRIGKLDRFMPRQNRQDVVAKIVVTQVNLAHGNRYEISASLDIPGGRVISAKDECSNVFAGIDILEAKLVGQVKKFKAEKIERNKRGLIRKLLKK